MKIRFMFASKIVLYTMCFIMVVTFVKYNKYLRTKSWPVFRINFLKGKLSGYKYILLWTKASDVPFCYMAEGQDTFISRNCPHTNCIVTANRSLLGDYTSFHVIAFHGPQLIHMSQNHLPQRRSPHQKYVFASIESAEYYPICSDSFDAYFNWTWTYKLDSDLRWGYIVIRDSEGNIIGPKADMNWLPWYSMSPVGKELKKQLKNKTKAVAWFVSNCQTRSRREGFALALHRYLIRYGLTLDIYGKCGYLTCPRENDEECKNMVKKDYYFYLSFENAFSEDYVTEKLLIALQNNAIPIVYGGADYDRFLPQGSYLNARELGLYELGDKINELINKPDEYEQYFKWKNHYSYHKMSETPETDEYCKMCALLNDKKLVTQTKIYENLQDWWNPPDASC